MCVIFLQSKSHYAGIIMFYFNLNATIQELQIMLNTIVLLSMSNSFLLFSCYNIYRYKIRFQFTQTLITDRILLILLE